LTAQLPRLALKPTTQKTAKAANQKPWTVKKALLAAVTKIRVTLRTLTPLSDSADFWLPLCASGSLWLKTRKLIGIGRS